MGLIYTAWMGALFGILESTSPSLTAQKPTKHGFITIQIYDSDDNYLRT